MLLLYTHNTPHNTYTYIHTYIHRHICLYSLHSFFIRFLLLFMIIDDPSCFLSVAVSRSYRSLIQKFKVNRQMSLKENDFHFQNVINQNQFKLKWFAANACPFLPLQHILFFNLCLLFSFLSFLLRRFSVFLVYREDVILVLVFVVVVVE